MRVDLIVKNIRKTRVLGDVTEKDLSKLKKHLKMFRDENLIRLEIRLEKSLHTEECSGVAVLSMPKKKTLRVSYNADDKLTCVNNLTKLLVKQLEKVKTQVERHLSPKRKGLADMTDERVGIKKIEHLDISE